MILDADTGKVVDVNPFLLQLLGYSYEAIYGQYIWELGVSKDIAASKDAFKTLQDNEYIHYDDLPLETLDRRLRVCWLRCALCFFVIIGSSGAFLLCF